MTLVAVPSRAAVTIQNLTVTDSAINESPCADDSTFSGNTLVRSSDDACN